MAFHHTILNLRPRVLYHLPPVYYCVPYILKRKKHQQCLPLNDGAVGTGVERSWVSHSHRLEGQLLEAFSLLRNENLSTDLSLKKDFTGSHRRQGRSVEIPRHSHFDWNLGFFSSGMAFLLHYLYFQSRGGGDKMATSSFRHTLTGLLIVSPQGWHSLSLWTHPRLVILAKGTHPGDWLSHCHHSHSTARVGGQA